MPQILKTPKSATKNLSEKKLQNCLSSEVNNLLSENEQLRKENKTLKTEVAQLNSKNKSLVELLNANKKKFEDNFTVLEKEISTNKEQLLENSKNCLKHQQKYLEEIQKLKEETELLKSTKFETETKLSEKLKMLESEIALLKDTEEKLKTETNDLSQKGSKYKLKLKHAIKIINELNNLIVHYSTKPVFNTETTQTEEYSCANPGSNISHSKTQLDLTTENLLLDDIFFKPKTFQETDVLFC